MNKKSTKLTSKDLIIARDNICKTKTRYWRIIKTENIMPTKAIKTNIGSGFNLKVLYNKILQMSNTLVKIKLMINAINSGITTFNYDDAKKTHYYNIYVASELKEHLAHWEEILKKSTINPAAKAKAGAKGTGKKETFSSAKITSIKKNLQLEINKIDALIAKYNEDTTLSIIDNDDDADVLNTYIA